MKILVDMNLSLGWAGFLTRNGIEAIHWSFIGSPDAPDSEIMTYAKTYDFTVLTCDLDFGYILAITQSKKPSVIQMRTGALGHDRIGAVVLSAIKRLVADIDKGALVTIDPRKTRVNLLPL
jgi:predicted nuclease of predicted toxin-antitoxin system